MIIAVVNNKGGVGKTTSAVNLSAAWAHAGKRTLLVDLDSQCSASRLTDKYDRVIFDCPPSLSLITLAAADSL